MSLPARPLEFKDFDIKRLKKRELRELRDRDTSIEAFGQILERFSNWTAAEIDELELGEIEAITKLFFAEVEKSTVPKVN